MPTFIQGVPATGSLLSSNEIRSNFTALNARTGKLTPQATFPISAKINIGEGLIYFSDNRVFQYKKEQVDLGDLTTGVEPFTEIGYFKDVAIVLRTKIVDNKIIPYATFIEGPEKASNILQLELINFQSTDLPICAIVVRHNGLSTTDKGQIQPIGQSAIIDIRGYIRTGGQEVYSTTVGDRVIPENGSGGVVLDGYGFPVIEGRTVGNFNGNSLQEAIDSLVDLGGGTVFIKKGYYEPSQTIIVPSNIEILGEGSATIIKRLDTFTGPLFRCTGTQGQIRNLQIQGPDSTVYASAPLISLEGANQCKICDLWFAMSNGICISVSSSTSRSICLNNILIGCETGITIEAGSTKNLVCNNQIEASVSSIINNEPTTILVGNVS